jgi:hypothetical protein
VQLFQVLVVGLHALQLASPAASAAAECQPLRCQAGHAVAITKQ